MNTKKSILVILILATCSAHLCSQEIDDHEEPEKTQVTYMVKDLLTEATTFQDFNFSIFPSQYYNIVKKNTITKKIISSDTEHYWGLEMYWVKVTQVPGQSNYVIQTLTKNFGNPNRSNYVFGRVEIKNGEDGSVIDAWPIFGNAADNKGMYTITLTTFIPKKGKLTKVIRYIKKEYPVPLSSQHEFTDTEGKVVSNILFTRTRTVAVK